MLTPEEEDELRRLVLLDWIRSDRKLFPGAAPYLLKNGRKSRKTPTRIVQGRGLGATPDPLPWSSHEEMIAYIKSTRSKPKSTVQEETVWQS